MARGAKGSRYNSVDAEYEAKNAVASELYKRGKRAAGEKVENEASAMETPSKVSDGVIGVKGGRAYKRGGKYNPGKVSDGGTDLSTYN